MDGWPPSVMARREWILPRDHPGGLSGTLTEALVTTQGLLRSALGALGPEAPGMHEGAATVRGEAAGTHSA